MRLVHWSYNLVTEVHGRRQGTSKRVGLGKPHGFWVSDEARGVHGWRAWCRNERFRTYGFRYEHEVKLSDKAKILYLRTAQDIDDFADKYKSDSGLNRSMANLRLHGPASIYEIDWSRVAKKYHGIIITPYQWSQRLGRHMWYYGWDCASGCIWNARAVESITMVKERKVPRKPTIWEEKRKHKRDMIRMAQASKDMVASMRKTRGASPLDDGLLKSADDILTRYGAPNVEAD